MRSYSKALLEIKNIHRVLDAGVGTEIYVIDLDIP